MIKHMVISLATVGLLLGAPNALAQSAPAGAYPMHEQSDARICAVRPEPRDTAVFLRTELYFGSNKPDGSVVTAEQFQQFLNDEITPRFPDGLTLLTGLGQFRGSNGIERERSMLLILLYPSESSRDSSRKIEEIRTAYEKRFQQESVLRADESRPECVSF